MHETQRRASRVSGTRDHEARGGGFGSIFLSIYLSLSLSLTICSLALALYQVLDRNCLKRSGAKRKCRAWHGSPKSSGVCNLQLRQEEDLKSDDSLVVEIKGTKMLTNKRLKEWAGWTPTSDEEQLSSKWKMIRKDQLEVEQRCSWRRSRRTKYGNERKLQF